MSGIFSSLSRIWLRDEPVDEEIETSRLASTSGSLENLGKVPCKSAIEKDNYIGNRRFSRTTLNSCSTSVSSPSCVISGYPKSVIGVRNSTSAKLEFPSVGHSRGSKPKRIMWDDSGYESPGQKRPSQIALAAEKELLTTEKNVSRHCYDDKVLSGDVNANTSKSHNNFGEVCYGEKFSIPPPNQYHYIPPSILNYRYQPRRPQRARSVGYDKLAGSMNDISLTGVSPICTSTPIKSTTKLELDSIGLPDDGSSYPAELFSFSSQSHQQLSCSEGTGLSFSNTVLTKEMVDESVSKIVQEGSDEFRLKYSQWIAQVFQIQLEKMQRRLTTQFSRNLESVIREKEREIIALQQKYRNKLIEFEISTEKFQTYIDSLSDENQRVRDTRDAIISEMEKTASDQKENFRIDVEQQINNVQAECEKEKLTLQRKHADQLKNINEKSMGQVTRLEEQFGKQVDSLQALIGELKSQNVTMEEQLTYFKKSSDQQQNILHNKYVNYHKEREQMLELINDLREKLSQSEKEKAAIVASHNEEIFNIQKESERINQNISFRMANSQSIVEDLQRKHEEEAMHLKKRLGQQESQYKQAIDDLRNTYGHKISHLTKTVEGLQRELMGGRTKRSNLV